MYLDTPWSTLKTFIKEYSCELLFPLHLYPDTAWKSVSRYSLEICIQIQPRNRYPDTAWKSLFRYSLETCIQILMQLANLYPGTVWNETSIQAEAIKKPNLTSELNINQTKNLDSILLFRHSLSSHSSPRPLPTLRPFFYPSPLQY